MAVKQGKGQFTILTPDVAVASQAAALLDCQPFLLCHELQKTGHGHDVSCVPLPQVESSVSAMYYTTVEEPNNKTVSLLPGCKKPETCWKREKTKIQNTDMKTYNKVIYKLWIS